MIGLLFVPVASSYMFYAFWPGSARLEESFVSLLNGHSYEAGNCVVQARRATYADQRWTMLVHTTFSAAALFLGVVQVLGRRHVSARAHRLVGWLFVACVCVGMAAGLWFSARSPAIQFDGGAGFRLQLVELGLATLASAVAGAYYATRRRQVAHRACMGLAMAFLMTAPLLRVGWAVLGPLIPSWDLLQNLAASSVALAVVAPAAGCLVVMAAPGRVVSVAVWSLPRQTGLVAAIVGFAGAGALWLQWRGTAGHGPAAYPWFHLVPALTYLGVCLVCARRAGRRGRRSREDEWRWLSLGAALVPTWTLASSWLIEVVAPGSGALTTGLMTAPGGPLLLSLGIVVGRRERTCVKRTAARSAVQGALRQLA